jgi:hypothetical protein
MKYVPMTKNSIQKGLQAFRRILQRCDPLYFKSLTSAYLNFIGRLNISFSILCHEQKPDLHCGGCAIPEYRPRRPLTGVVHSQGLLRKNSRAGFS